MNMATVVVMFQAGPTPWEKEGRLVGDSSLPLTAEAIDSIRRRVNEITLPIKTVYRPAANEACVQAAQIISQKFGVRARDNANLNEMRLGLWQGLLPDEVRQRFTTAYRKWEEEPLVVTPPEGESLDAAIDRIGAAAKNIARRNRGSCVALALRPLALRIAAGVLRGQVSGEIAAGLHSGQPVETIELPDAA